jgi:hypothetical protein
MVKDRIDQRFPWRQCLSEMIGTALLLPVVIYYFESDRDRLFRGQKRQELA